MPILSHWCMAKDIPIIGLKFNFLTVIKQEGRYKDGTKLYVCKCDCGSLKDVITSKSHLRSGLVKSCGCYALLNSAKNGRRNKLDLTGMKFNMLTVIKEIRSHKRYGYTWLCKCECGNTTEVVAAKLKNGEKGIKSCGCYHPSTNLASRGEAWSVEMNNYISGNVTNRNRKRKLKINFTLSLEEFKNLIVQNCFYCNRIPHMECSSIGLKEQGILKNSIDRINNDLGYTKENVVACCSSCNREKMDQTFEDYIINIEKKYLFLKSKGIIK